MKIVKKKYKARKPMVADRDSLAGDEIFSWVKQVRSELIYLFAGEKSEPVSVSGGTRLGHRIKDR